MDRHTSPPQPQDQTPDQTPAPGSTGLRHRMLGWRGVAAVALASVILGGAGGAALGALTGGQDTGQRGGRPGGLGGAPAGMPGQLPPGTMPSSMPGTAPQEPNDG
jgi:hypothetical protein